jgi:hypothetical protein
MTETQGLIAGMLLFFALYLYIFWPEKVSQARSMITNQGIQPPLKQDRTVHSDLAPAKRIP